jgi:hypothetical protein
MIGKHRPGFELPPGIMSNVEEHLLKPVPAFRRVEEVLLLASPRRHEVNT